MDVHRAYCARAVRALRLLAIITLLVGPAAYGQTGFKSRFDVRGEVLNTAQGDSFQVQLVSFGGEDRPMMSDVSGSGAFEFDSVRPGEYILRLTDLNGNTVCERPVSVSGPGDDLTIRLPRQRVEKPVSGTVSVRELQHKIAPKAVAEYRKGMSDSQKRRFDNAIVHFQKAIAIDPSFADAHNELGALFYSLNQIDDATSEFRKASELDPDAAFIVCNLALVMLRRDQYPEAEAAARAALRADPGLSEAHFLLGYSLYQQKRNDLEAVENLRWAGNQHPKSRLLAAEILTQLGRTSEAADELKKYLESSDTGVDRRQVESWLSALRSASQPSPGAGNVVLSSTAGSTIP